MSEHFGREEHTVPTAAREPGATSPSTGTLTGQVALVTGGTRGIGLGIAERLLSEGASVLVTSTSSQGTGIAERGFGVNGSGRVFHQVCDVASAQEVRACVDRCMEEFGRIDIAVANAGTDLSAPFLEMTREEWERVLAVNLTGVFHTIQLSARSMVEQGGRLIVVSSTNAFYVEPGCAAYNASKAGLRGLVRSAALELAVHGITVNAVSPGLVTTRMSMEVTADPKYAAAYLQQIPLGRFGSPADVAAAVVYLSSREASWITGQEIVVDGGRTIGMYSVAAGGG
jgi:glucose 1-dehydrogenase